MRGDASSCYNAKLLKGDLHLIVHVYNCTSIDNGHAFSFPAVPPALVNQSSCYKRFSFFTLLVRLSDALPSCAGTHPHPFSLCFSTWERTLQCRKSIGIENFAQLTICRMRYIWHTLRVRGSPLQTHVSVLNPATLVSITNVKYCIRQLGYPRTLAIPTTLLTRKGVARP